jgi:hypothetical protein
VDAHDCSTTTMTACSLIHWLQVAVRASLPVEQHKQPQCNTGLWIATMGWVLFC